MGAGQRAQISHLICARCAEPCRGQELLPASRLSIKKGNKRRTSGCLVSFDGKFHKEKMTQDLGKAAKHDPVAGNSRLHLLSNQIIHLARGKNSALWSFILKQLCDQTVCRLHFNIFSSQRKRKAGHQGGGGLDAGLVLWSGRVQRHQVEPGRHFKACRGSIDIRLCL